MIDKSALGGVTKLIAGLLAGSFFVLPALAQSNQAEPTASAPAAAGKATPAKGAVAKDAAAKDAAVKGTAAKGAAGKDTATKDASATPARKLSPYRPEKLTKGAKTYYAAAWGVDKLKVSYTQSGNLIRFSYRVSDPERAKVLGDKQATALLYGQKSRAVLSIPVMDKVGPLRQTGAPIAGQEYWMVFSNKGNLVKPGDRVNVVIGSFHADGLTVE